MHSLRAREQRRPTDHRHDPDKRHPQRALAVHHRRQHNNRHTVTAVPSTPGSLPGRTHIERLTDTEGLPRWHEYLFQRLERRHARDLARPLHRAAGLQLEDFRPNNDHVVGDSEFLVHEHESRGNFVNAGYLVRKLPQQRRLALEFPRGESAGLYARAVLVVRTRPRRLSAGHILPDRLDLHGPLRDQY